MTEVVCGLFHTGDAGSVIPLSKFILKGCNHLFLFQLPSGKRQYFASGFLTVF
jgi:hypothetical protein